MRTYDNRVPRPHPPRLAGIGSRALADLAGRRAARRRRTTCATPSCRPATSRAPTAGARAARRARGRLAGDAGRRARRLLATRWAACCGCARRRASRRRSAWTASRWSPRRARARRCPSWPASTPRGADRAAVAAAAGRRRAWCAPTTTRTAPGSAPRAPLGRAAAGCRSTCCPGAGHVNAEAGFGPWPAMRRVGARRGRELAHDGPASGLATPSSPRPDRPRREERQRDVALAARRAARRGCACPPTPAAAATSSAAHSAAPHERPPRTPSTRATRGRSRSPSSSEHGDDLVEHVAVEHGGTKPAPMPWMRCGPGARPESTARGLRLDSRPRAAPGCAP